MSVLSPKKFGIRRIPSLGIGGLKNEISHVTHFISMKKICIFRGQKSENKPLQPKNGIWGPKDGRVIYPSFENFT
jgi:hypothetical protein